MIGLLVAGVCFGWLIMTVLMARRIFRSELAEHTAHYSRMYGQPLPDHSRKVALGKAYNEVIKWPATLAFAVLDWLITTEHLFGVPDSLTDPWNAPEKFTVIDGKMVPLPPGKVTVIGSEGSSRFASDARPERDGTDELIERLDKELNRPTQRDREAYLTAKYGPLNDSCPCGYRTECPIHCGSGHATDRCPSYPEIK